MSNGRDNTPVYIGLDVGTTAVKVAAFDVGGTSGTVAMALRECRLLQPEPGWQVVDPVTLLEAVDDALQLVFNQVGDLDVIAISVSTAMHGLLGWDAQMNPVTPVITWADSRAAEMARQVRTQGLAEMLLHRTGTPVHSMSPLMKLMWLGRHEPELVGEVRWWGGVKELVLHHLTGELVSEYSTASGTGLLGVNELAWDEVALDLAGVTADRLPRLVSPTQRLSMRAELAAHLGIDRVEVVAGAADGPLGNLGTGAIVPGVVGLSLGTSGAVRMPVERPTFDDAGRLFCYALTEDLWVTGGPVSNGGIAFDWATRTFAPEMLSARDPGKPLEIAASAPPGSDGLVMIPYLLAERAPLWDPDLPGAFLGIRFDHRRQHFLRAALEGVCLQVAAIVDILDSVQPVSTVRATGGPFRAQLWRNVMAAMLDRPFFVASDAGGTALGAAALGVYAMGEADSLADALRQLGGVVAGDDADEQPVAVSRGAVEAYRRLRASVPTMIQEYARVGELFG